MTMSELNTTPGADRKLRVLIVDDSIVVRRILRSVFDDSPDMEVVGYAPNGKLALARIPQVNPDVLTLDVEMPDMDGFETLKRLRVDYPRLPVIMFSTLTSRGATATLEALTLGASDYVAKPSNVGSVTEGLVRLRDELLPKIRQICNSVPRAASPEARPRPFVARRSSVIVPARPQGAEPAVVQVVAIGCSTGGPNALNAIFADLPKDFPVPILITQHMPKLFTQLLAERLDAISPLSVVEAKPDLALAPGKVFIAPGEKHLIVRELNGSTLTVIDESPAENYCRPSVDPMLRSLSARYGRGVLAVILTGMGQDGFAGCEVVRAAGGQVLAQDEATSVVWGMPGVVAEAGLADAILPLGRVAHEIMKRVARRS